MKDIFICYQAKDSARSHLFYKNLEEKGYDVWIYEKHCYGGRYHREQVLEEIKKSTAFVIIMSENSIKSKEVTYELKIAKQENKPIFPVYFDLNWEDYLNIKTDWEIILQSRTGIDAERNLEKAIENLLLGLRTENILPKNRFPDSRERIVPVAFTGSLDHFINRTKELDSIKAYVADNDTRFLLLTGPGGYGKSAIIEKLINEITDNYNLESRTFKYNIDSIIWIDLSVEENRSVDTVFNMLSKTFVETKAIDYKKAWNNESNLSNKLDFLFGRLLGRDKRLIILDNFESILGNTKINEQYKDIEDFINAFLNINHTSILIATSRRSLTLSNEIEGKHSSKKREIILDYGLPLDEAVSLIMKLDTDRLCEEDDPKKNILKDVARKIECVPRTIETLIGILKNEDRNLSEFYSEKEFEDLIANPTKELISGLKKEQKLIIEVLSVLSRPVKKDTIQSFFPDKQVWSQLASLKRCFAIKINQNKEYYLHSIIQKVVYDQIAADHVSIKNLHKKAADWYASQHLDKDKWAGFDEVKSLINEIQHRIQAAEYNRACEILNFIDREYLAVWNYYSLVIQLRSLMMDKITDVRLNELNIGNLGCALYETGQATEGVKYYNKALEISRTTKNIAGEARWLGNLALVTSDQNTESAEQMMEEAYNLALKAKDDLHIGRWQGKLASIKQKAGEISIEERILELENALKIARLESVNDKRFESYWLIDLYKMHIQIGNDDIAIKYLDEAIEVTEIIGDHRRKAEYLIESYNFKIKYTKPIQIIDSVEQAFELKLKVSSGIPSNSKDSDEESVSKNIIIGQQKEAYVIAEYLATFYLSLGKAEKALEKYNQMLEFSRETGNHSRELYYLTQIGVAQFMKRDFEQSLSSFLEVKKRRIEFQVIREAFYEDYNIADSYIQLFDIENALRHFKLALGKGNYTDFMAHYNIALICLKQKKITESDKHFNYCFEAYNGLAENKSISNQNEFIYTIILVLRNKTIEAKKKIQMIFNSNNLELYTLKMALNDVRLAKKILPEFDDFTILEDLLIDKIKIENDSLETR